MLALSIAQVTEFEKKFEFAGPRSYLERKAPDEFYSISLDFLNNARELLKSFRSLGGKDHKKCQLSEEEKIEITTLYG